MHKAILILVLVVLSTNLLAANLTSIESSPPGARIIINSEYVGDAPVSVDLDKYFTWNVGSHGEFVSDALIIKAIPSRSGCVQSESLKVKASMHSPKQMFFDTRLCPITPALNLNVN